MRAKVCQQHGRERAGQLLGQRQNAHAFEHPGGGRGKSGCRALVVSHHDAVDQQLTVESNKKSNSSLTEPSVIVHNEGVQRMAPMYEDPARILAMVRNSMVWLPPVADPFPDTEGRR